MGVVLHPNLLGAQTAFNPPSVGFFTSDNMRLADLIPQKMRDAFDKAAQPKPKPKPPKK